MNVAVPAFLTADEPVPFLARRAARVARQFRWTRERSLTDAASLAYWYHLFRRDDAAFEICTFLAQATDTSSFHWYPIEQSLALRARIARLRGDASAASESVARIHSVRFVGARLAGLLLFGYEENIQRSLANEERRAERDWREIAMKELCILIELGGSPDLPVSELERRYKANLDELRRLVKAVSADLSLQQQR